MKSTTLFLLYIMLVAPVGVTAKEVARSPGSLSQNFDLGAAAVDVTVSFDSVQNLNALTLGLTALTVNPLDALLLARLPAAVSIPAEFPVKIDISPPSVPLTGLQFDGIATIELYTTDLEYTPGTRLRLFSSHDGGPFVDITRETSAGSYRVRGSQGEFSEFLIIQDDRDSATVVDAKVARLSAELSGSESAIDSALFTTLSGFLASAQSAWDLNDVDTAKIAVSSFASAVSAASAANIPQTWRSTQDLDNVAGRLRSIADTLLYSLEDARDTDQDDVYDFADNCTLVSNADQCDTDGDGFGNRCDADLDNSGAIDTDDVDLMRDNFGSAGSNAADLDCNGIVNSFDLVILRQGIGGVPGPAN